MLIHHLCNASMRCQRTRRHREGRNIIYNSAYQLIMASIDNNNNELLELEKTTPSCWVPSLQHICRRTILATLGLTRLQDVEKLPLPTSLKEYLGNLSISDFDLGGFYLNYNVLFPDHPHHASHQVHPAKCRIDGSRVLIKSQNRSRFCNTCKTLGRRLIYEQEAIKWISVLSHPNLMNCLATIPDEGYGVTSYVLEFPLISLKDFMIRLSYANLTVPEYLLWDIMRKLTSVLMYLYSKDVHYELHEPQHIVLTMDGEIKLENLVLYLPTQGKFNYRAGIHQNRMAIYTAPEQWQGESVPREKLTVWGLGCILYELAATQPAFLLEKYVVQVRRENNKTNLRPVSPLPLPREYSHKLRSTIFQCLHEYASVRPSLQELQALSQQVIEAQPLVQRHPASLLDLMPHILQDHLDSE